MTNKTTNTVTALLWTIATYMWLVPDTSEIEDDDGSPRTKDVFFVVAISHDGVVYRHYYTFDTQERADSLMDRIKNASWSSPLNSPHWSFFRVEYGSEAYARDWRRYEAETELAERTTEVGPHAAYDSLSDNMKMALA
jgi:hypothetical protein